MADATPKTRKYVTLRSRREEIVQKFGREPTAFEERALAELPLLENGKSKELNDTSTVGRRIRQLLEDSERYRDVSCLEDAGELLFMRAYFMQSYLNPRAIEQAGTEAERAKFTHGGHPFSDAVFNTLSYPTQTTHCVHQATAEPNGERNMRVCSSHPENHLRKPTSPIPNQHNAINPAAVEAERATFMPTSTPIPTTRFSMLPLPSTVPDSLRTHNTFSNGRPTDTSYAQNPRSSPAPQLPLLRQPPPTRNGLTNQNHFAPNIKPLNHNGWHQLQPQHYQPTTDPHAHSLSNGTANLINFQMMQYNTSDMPRNTNLKSLNVQKSAALPPICQDNQSRYHPASQSPSVPLAGCSALKDLILEIPPPFGPSNTRTNSNGSQQVAHSLPVRSIGQADANGPATNVLSSMLVPLSNDVPDVNIHYLGDNEPFRHPARTKRPKLNNQPIHRDPIPSALALPFRIIPNPPDGERQDLLRQYAIDALKEVEVAEETKAVSEKEKARTT